MEEELGLLRMIAANPFDRAPRGVYRDWLIEHDRQEEADAVARTITEYNGPKSANFMSNSDLIGILIGFPPEAGIIYDACSDYSSMGPQEVTLISAEEPNESDRYRDTRVVFREEQGYVRYDPNHYKPWDQIIAEAQNENAREYYRRLRSNEVSGRYPRGLKPDFRTVVHFPGN